MKIGRRTPGFAARCPTANAVAPATRVACRLLLPTSVKQVINAGLGGGAATAVDVTVLIALVETGTPVAAAAFVAAACGAVVGFVWGKYLAFRDRSPLAARQLIRYAGVALATALLMAVAMQLFAVELHVPYVLAKLMCSALVFAAWTYPAQRRFVFRRAYV